MERSRLWLRRGAVFVTTCLALTVAVPLGQATPAGESRFPLAGLWELLTTKPLWALERPTVPIQMTGDGDRPARVSSDATRAGEGVGRPLDPIGAGLRPHEPLGRPKAAEWTTPKATNGFDPATSRLVQAGTGSDYELYENADGSFTRRIHTQPVNYRAADGRWVPIDTTLVRSPEGRWQTAANSMQVSFAAAPAAQSWGGGPVTDPAAEGTASGDLAKVALPSGALLAYQLSNARLAAPRIDGPAATYVDALPATDLTLVAVLAGIEARLELKDRTAANSWVFPLRSQGLTPKAEPGGSISLVDKVGAAALTIPKPAADFVRYELVTQDGQPALRVTADRAWLDDKARAYPVRVEVTVRSDDKADDVEVKASGARSVLKFDNFGQASRAASDKTAGLNVTKATLNLSHVQSSRCETQQKVYAYAAGASPVGELLIDNNYPACQNRAGDRWVNRRWKMPITDLSVLRDGNLDKGIALAAETGGRFAEPSLEMTLASNTPPQVEAQYPAHGYTTPTLTPELLVLARDPDNGPAATTYRFFVYEVSGTTTTPVVDSGGFSAATAWTVPAGPLQRGKNYVWTVQAWDGMDAATSNTWNSLSTHTVQQPITSALSQNGGKGIAPNIGNYTNSAIDAQVPTAGPALAVERFYNSRDPRTEQAFGAGWSSILDAKVTGPVDDRLVITYPNGQDVTFGRNPTDGTYFAPEGRHATLTGVAGAFGLVDKDGTQYLFTLTSGYKLFAVTDSVGRTLKLNYGPGGQVSSIEAASGRKLTITWLGSHVSEVTNDMGEKWTYFYTGNTLTKVCPPTSATACTTYLYGSNWAHPTAVQDASPHTYLRLNEPVGSVTAASSVRDNVDTTIGVYRNVSLGQPGIISQAGTAAGFNGTTSHVELPKKLALAGSWQTVSLWFKTTGSGVLYSYQRGPLSDTGTPGWMPALYVGTDGKLRGEFYQGGLSPITSAGTVNNGAWHHAVLTTRGNTQSLYLDGAFVGSLAGVIDASWAAHSYIGAGKWLSYPATSGTVGWFNGSISNFAFYSRPLNDLQIALMNSSGRTASAPLTRITRPSTGISAQIAYDTGTGEVTQVTDESNGVWKVSKPQVSGTGEVYASTVMSAAPADYFRMINNTSNEVNGITGSFNNVVLGHYGGPLGESAASFDGSLSEVVGSGSSIDTSQSYSLSSWVYLGSKGTNRSIATVESNRMTPFLFGYDGAADRWRMLVCDNDTDTPFCPGVQSSAVPQVNTWTHLAATVDAPSKTVKLYVNGELQGTSSFPAQWKAQGPFSIGRVKWRGSYADRWPGRLTEMATFGSTLTEGQVREQYAARDKARSYRQLPVDNIVTSGPNSVSLWFRLPAADNTGGVLYGYQSGQISNPGGTFGWNPALYVDTWGKLRGQFWTGSISPMTSADTVNDGQWHHAVLAASTNTQDLYLDGVKVASLAGTVSPNGSIPYIGAGKWLNWGDTAGDIGYFGGEISDFGFHTVQLSAAQISAQFAAGRGTGLEVSGSQGTPISTVALTDPGNQVTKYLYDLYSGGRMIEQVDPFGARTRYGYDEKGFLRTTADPNGNLTVDKHDVRGNVIERSTCQDRVTGKCSTTYYTYYPNATDRVLAPDARNDKLLTVRDGRSSGATDNTYLTQYGYDPEGNLVTVTDPLGRITRTDYSATDRVPVDLTGLSGSGRYVRVRSTALSFMNNNYSLWEVEVFGPSGVNLSHRRTVAGSSAENSSMDAPKAFDGDPTTRWSSVQPPAAAEWVQVDLVAVQAISRVRLTWHSAFAANYEIQVSNDASTWTTIKSVAGEAGKKMPAGLPLRTSKPNGAVELTHYTYRGDVSETIDAARLAAAYTYDAAGRVLTETVKADGGDKQTVYTYDAAGRVKTVTDPPTVNLVTGANHARVTTTTYNVDGQITSTRVTDSTGGDAARESTSGYNLLGQKTSETDPRNKTTTYEYDLFGRATKVTNPEGVATRNVYDKNGNRTQTWLVGWRGDPNNPQAPADKKIESRGYDPGGRLSTVTDAMDWTTEYRYTDNGLLKSATRIGPFPASFVLESYVYDTAGNRTETITNNGTTRVVSTVDAASRPTSQTVDPTGLNRKTEFTYGLDDTVLTTKISDGSGAAQYVDSTYDIAGRQVSQTASTIGTNGLAGHWKLTGGDASDSFGNSRGTATSISWPLGGPATFNGTSSEIAAAGPVIDTSQSFTVAVQARLADKAMTRVVLSQRGQNRSAFQLEYTSATDRWSAVAGAADGPGAAVTVPSDAAPTAGNWSHLAAVYDAPSKTLKLYVNGTLQSSVATVSIFSGSGKLIMSGEASNRFKGNLQDLRVYQRALTPAEIAQAFNQVPLPANPASRVSTTSDRQGFQTSMRDPNGNVTTTENDAAGRPARVTSAPVATEENGGATVTAPVVNTLGYNTFGERVESKDGRGKVTVTVRDANGQATEDHLPEYITPGSGTPLNPVVKAEYDNLGRVKKTIDALLRETSYVYDQLGRVASTTQPNGGVAKYTYTLNGEQTSVTDPMGGRVEATYDYLGRRLTATQLLRSPSAAHTTNYGYHAASGFLASTTPPGRTATTYLYNVIGETTKVTDGAGVPVEFGYDFAGRQAFTKLADASKQTTAYDFAGRPLTQQTLDPAGAVYAATSLTYDASGQVLTAKDARNAVTSFAYDVRGKLTQVVQPVAAGDSITTSFGYDTVGNRTRFTDGRNNRFITTYNAWNAPESAIEPATAAHPNAPDRTFTTVYDIAGQPVEVRSPGGVNAVHTYNSLGQLTGSTGSGAEIATAARTFGYDLAGRLTSLSGSGGTNTITYDDRGLITSATGPSGASSFAYTPDGLLQTRTDAAGTTTYGYDTGGRLSTAANATAGIQVGYGYNNLSQVSQITYGSNQDRRVLGYATDGSHRLVSDELKTAGSASVAKITYGWDKNGNLTSKTTTGFAGASANSYGYDQANRLTSWTVGATTINYGWDKSGNRISVGLNNFTYDERNRLLSATDGRSWTYSARGTMRSMATGTVTLPTDADAFGQVIRQYTSASAYSENIYDGLGRLVRPGFSFSGTGNDLAADPNAKYVRGPGGALLGVKPSGTGVYCWTDLHTDVVGQFGATSTTLSGSTTYDPFGQVLATSGMQGSLGYQSGWTDTATGRVNMHARWYNPASGAFDTRDSANLSPVPASINANRYTYGNGNPLVNVDPTGHEPMATGSDVEEAMYIAGLPEAEATAVKKAKSEAVKKAIKSGAGGPATGPPAKKGPPPPPAPPCITNHQADGSTDSNVFGCTKNNACIRNHDVDGSSTSDPWACVVQTDPNIIDDGGIPLCVSEECENERLLNGGVTINGPMTREEVLNQLKVLGYQGSDAMPLRDVLAFAAIHPRNWTFVCIHIFGWVTAEKDNPCQETMSPFPSSGGGFEFFAGLLPVIGTAIDLYKCGRDTNAEDGIAADCWWAAVSVIPFAKLAKLGKMGKFGESVLSRLGGQSELLAKLRRARGGVCPAALRSFTGDTQVLMADMSRKAIKELKPGDEVHSEDPETGEKGGREVTAVWAHKDSIVELRIDGKVLRTTEDHPFWNDTDREWQRADQLDAGDQLLTANGSHATVNGITRALEYQLDAYNLTVDDLHTYYVVVSDSPVLVHNDKSHITCDAESYINTYGSQEYGEGISGYLSSDGTLYLSVKTVEGLPKGKKMFDDMMRHFGSDVRAVHGVWTSGGDMADNLESFNAGIQLMLSKEEAAWLTWTGKMAQEHEFTRITDITVEGTPGNYTSVEVIFEK